MTGCFDFIERMARPFERIVLKYSTFRPTAWALFVVVLAAGVSLFSRFPAYTSDMARFPGSFVAFATTPYGQAIKWWLDHPFQPVPTDVFFPAAVRGQALIAGSISHCDKLNFRVFLPLLNQLIDGGVWTLFGANHAATLITFLLIYRLGLRATADTVLASVVTWSYAACWAGGWGFNDLVCGDAVAIALLLGALAVRPGSWLVAGLVLAAGFTDERAICAAPLVALLRWWTVQPPFAEGNIVFDLRRAWNATAPVFAGLAAYAACRWYVVHHLGIHASTSMMATPEILLYHVYVSYPNKLFGVFEFLWVFPLLLLFSLGRAGAAGRRNLLAFGFCLLCAAAPAFMVWDIDRSLCYLLPGVVASIGFLPGEAWVRRRTAMVAGAASLFWLEPNASILRLFIF